MQLLRRHMKSSEAYVIEHAEWEVACLYGAPVRFDSWT
jgi:hypothetical protein